MDRFLNALKAQAGAMDLARGEPRFATVTSVDSSNHAAKVLLQPEGVLSGWLPVLSPWVGAGWGLASPPTPGEQVFVVPQEGDAEHGVIVGRAFSLSALPPPAPAGELWLVHQSGSFLKLHNDGTIEAHATTFNFTGNMVLSGNLTVTENVTVQENITAAGDITDQNGAHGSLATLRGAYNQHTHGNVQSGSANTATTSNRV